jgi:Mg2+ and Co2+ transporter CorA
MICKTYKADIPDKAKDTIDLVLETLWMANCSRELLASVYGIHPITLARWLSGETSPEKYRFEIFRHHQFILGRLYESMGAMKK